MNHRDSPKLGPPRWKGVLTIDGLAAVGKTAVSRIISRGRVPTLEVGALYRQLARELWETGTIELPSAASGSQAEDRTLLTPGSDYLSTLLRVTQNPRARALVTEQQLRWADGYEQSIVVGRVSGWLFVDAALKVFLTATAEAKAERLRPLGAKAVDAVRIRDSQDMTRLADPVRPAKDALVIDTTDLSAQSVALLIEEALIDKAGSRDVEDCIE